MSEAWIGLIGALLGTVVGAGISVLVSLREQQRAPKVFLVEKRHETYNELYRKLFTMAEWLRRDEPIANFVSFFTEFKETFLNSILYLDDQSRKKNAALYNFLEKALVEGEFKSRECDRLINEAMEQLFNGLKKI